MARFDRSVLTVLAVVFVDVLGLTVMIPLLPFYAQQHGATPALVGLLIATYAAGSLLMGPVLGRWADRYGRKPVLMLSQAGSLLGFLLLALAPALWWLFLARALDGLTSGNLPAARAYIADRTAPDQRAYAFGLISAAFGLAFMIGPLISAGLSPHGLQAPLWASACLSLLALSCTARFLPGGRTGTTDPVSSSLLTGSMDRAPKMALADASGPLWQLFGFFLAFSCFTAGIALFAERRLSWNGAPFGAAEVGLALACTGALGLFAQFVLLEPLVRRWGEGRLAWICLWIVAAAYLGLGWSADLATALLCLGVLGAGNSLLRPTLMSVLSRAVPAHQQGFAFGVSQSLQAMATLIAPLAAGGLIHLGWLGGWSAACAFGIGLAIIASARPRDRRKDDA